MLRTLLILSALPAQFLFSSVSAAPAASATPNSATRAKSAPLTFKWADDTPIVGRTFAAYKKAELAKLHSGETLEITGLYSAAEQIAAGNPAPNLGLARAAKTAALFAPSNQKKSSRRPKPMKLTSGLVTDDSFSEITKKMAPFASVSFGIAPMPRPHADDSRLQIPTDILFPISKVKRHPNLETSAFLERLAGSLKTGTKRVVLTGFADSRGSSDTNLRLAKQRAESVKQELIKLGVATDRIEIATNSNPAHVPTSIVDDSIEGRQRNRRVEVSFP